jgi:Tol biopolymer transport system component
MSPEQAKGKPVDKRTDIFAFGCVLYEMLTGHQAFEGEDAQDILSRVLQREPDWSKLPSSLPPRVMEVLRGCLEKDVKNRRRDMGDVRIDLEHALKEPKTEPLLPASADEKRPRRWVGLAIASAVAVVLGLAAGTYFHRSPAVETPGPITRLTITPSVTEALTVNRADRDLAISPDGKRIAWIGPNRLQLFVRDLDQLEPRAIGSIGNPLGVFFSPDGQSIGFFNASSSLLTVPIHGGSVTTVIQTDGLPVGASWNADGTIVFATTNALTGLQRVAVTGGAPTVLTRPNQDRGEADHRWPQFLPDGHTVVFTIAMATGGNDNNQIAIFDLRTGHQKVILRGSDARYVSNGYLLFHRADGALWAVGFDINRLETNGTPVRVVPQVASSTFGAADFDVAENGTLVYVATGGAAVTRSLVWVDREGREEPINAPPRAYLNPRISPDGKRLAIEDRNGEGDIWIWDFTREVLTRLTLDPAADRYPVWTSDGQRVIFSSNRAGALNLFWQPADGTGTAERLTTSLRTQLPTTISPDDSQVVFHENTNQVPYDLMTIALDGSRRVRPLLQTPAAEQNADISRDGRWLAYQSTESGEFEIFVRPFPNVNDGRVQVSSNGGVRPVWSRDGRELFYLTLTGTLMGVTIEAGSIFTFRTPRKVFDANYYFGVIGSPRTYDVAPDGRRFLMIKSVGETTTPASVVVVQNWFDELKRLVPTKP